MNRIFWSLFLSFVIASTAVAQGTYQRKRVQPGFFVPSKELNRVEKLPPFPMEEEVIVIKKQKPEPEVIEDTPLPAETPKVIYNDFRVVPHTETVPEQEAETPNLEDNEEYQVRRAEYQESLDAIAQNGAAPMTPALAEDLSKMNSNDRLTVE